MKRAAVAAALAFILPATTLLSVPRSAAAAVPSNARLDAVVLGIERYYRAENAGAADAFVERAQRAGLPVGTTERCRLPSGASSTRPTVLANPPLAESAIRQRGALLAVIGAYANLAAAVSANPSSAGAPAASLAQRVVRAQLVAGAVELQRAAAAHAQGDLFLEDEARELSQALVGRPDALAGVVHRLAAILTSDLDRQRGATVAATTLAYDVRATRDRDPLAGRTAEPPGLADRAAQAPACSEPAIFDASPYRAAGAAPASDARASRLRRRMDAARRVDPRLVLQAMLAPAGGARLACVETNFVRAAGAL